MWSEVNRERIHPQCHRTSHRGVGGCSIDDFVSGASLQTIPIQMTPDIDKPILQVRVSWPGASPKDVEQEVVLRLERELTGLSGVQNVVSDSRRGSGRVSLTYEVGHDMDDALVKLLGS